MSGKGEIFAMPLNLGFLQLLVEEGEDWKGGSGGYKRDCFPLFVLKFPIQSLLRNTLLLLLSSYFFLPNSGIWVLCTCILRDQLVLLSLFVKENSFVETDKSCIYTYRAGPSLASDKSFIYEFKLLSYYVLIAKIICEN